MTAAILQIVGMLIVAYLLGMLTIWPYWRKKYRTRKEALESEILDREEKLSQKEKHLSETRSKLAETERKITEYKQELSRKEKQLQESVEKAGELEVSLEETRKSLETKISQEKEKNKTLSDQLSGKNTEVNVLQTKLENLENTLTEKNEQITGLMKEKPAEPHSSSYYRIIDGIKYKNATLLKAEEAIRGRGDGRISRQDAEILFASISDGHQYTDVEKNTIKYLRENFNWTDAADEYFRHEVRVWAAKGHKLEE